MEPQVEPSVNQERAARVKFTKRLAARGINTPDIIGHHGTSIEALEVFINTGKFPGSTEPPHPDPAFPQPKDVYFFPNALIHPNMVEDDLLTTESSVEGARGFASRIAKAHKLLKSMGLPLESGGISDAHLKYFMERQ